MLPPPLRRLHARRVLLAEGGWAEDVAITVAADGSIAGLTQGQTPAPDAEIIAGPVVPALPNLHSHAFQRALAGLAEVSGGGDDSFWTWRDAMYRLVGTLTPEDVEAIATRLYVDLLKGGYGGVAEFHYLHHGQDGTPYADRAEMGARLLAAAGTAGIGLTLLPVFYAHGNFGGTAAAPGQRRFLHDVDGFLALRDALAPLAAAAGAGLGTALHSLRAATPDEIAAILAALPAAVPIHIHIAEQQREVEDCLAWCGRRPIAWLMDNVAVDRHWCLVHATHAEPAEIAAMVASRAVVGLCPTTEASLGDGLFPADDFHRRGGLWGIGSDSHVAVSAAEELRLLEYGQRLRDRKRVRIVAGPGRSNGRALVEAAVVGGSRALGHGDAGLRVGAPASFVVLDHDDAMIAAARGDAVLDRWIFALGDRAVRDVMIAGAWRIRDCHHPDDTRIDQAFRQAIDRLAAA